MKRINFIYQDAEGNISFRVLSVISESTEYIRGYCLRRNGFRHFKKERILETINDSSDETLNFYLEKYPLPSEPQNREEKFEICFTGFKTQDKQKLIKLAENSEMVVRSGVTANLTALCYGCNAGPKKLEKARQKGLLVLSEDQFLTLLETGEVPDEVA